jgi:2-polyprenyl-6-methoxyphenol hydroxylase-like FAD-dependent oxidoreductase
VVAHAEILETPVLIVGGGPVGLMLALNLDALGVASLVVNTEPTTRWVPKGSTQNARTMEHYRRLGLARAIRKLGLPPEYPTDVGYFTRLNGFELARIAMPSEAAKRRAVAEAPADDQTPEPLLRCNQMYVERFLLDHARTRPNVALRYGWECVDWRHDGDGVEAEIVEAETGRRASVRAAYLAGCDGPQSATRRRLGIRYEGDVLSQAYMGGPMVNTHVRAPEFYARVRSRPCWQYWAVNPEVRSNLVVLDGRDEFIFTTKLRAPDDKPDDAAIARQFNATVGTDVGVEFLAHSPWMAGQALVAERLGAGRVFLAGDSAHLFTPTGAFGMNTGVDEAMNLAWKLAACVQGWGGPKLLPTYELERHAIARRNTRASQALAKNVGAVPVDAAMEDATPEGEAARARAAAYLSTFGEEFASLGIQLGARYDGSPIIVPDETEPPPDEPTRYVASACPGGRAPHVWLDDEGAGDETRVSLYDRLGRGFTLLRLHGGADVRGLAAAAEARHIPLALLDVRIPEARDLYARDLALVRPDMHVAWRGDRLPEDCDALSARITGW